MTPNPPTRIKQEDRTKLYCDVSPCRGNTLGQRSPSSLESRARLLGSAEQELSQNKQ